MKAIVLVAFGGAIGSVFRYLIALWMKNLYAFEFPWHTFSVNIIGCLVIGFMFSITLENSSLDNIRLFVMVGILGGFTTYSSFGLETFDLFKQGKIILASTYILTTNIFGLAAVFCGYTFHKLIG
jgi:fluoride exporter